MIVLSRDGVDAEIDPIAGGRLRRLTVRGRDVIADFRDDIGDEHEHWYGGSFPLAPWAGRVPAQIRWNGGEVALPTDAGGSAVHGWAADVGWRVLSSDPHSAVLSTVLDDRSPWRAELTQTFVLEPHRLTITLALVAESAMPCVLGFHPWFPREANGELPTIEFEARARVLPASSLDGSDVETAEPADLPRDDLYRDVVRPPRVLWRDGTTLTLHSDAPIWVVYERHPAGFCIEPWTGTPQDAATGASRVEAGATEQLTFALDWS